jgi:hypothetical protein
MSARRKGCAIRLTERKSGGPTDQNWVAISGILDGQELARYNEIIVELRKTAPQVDWSSVDGVAGSRTLALWFSEVDKP